MLTFRAKAICVCGCALLVGLAACLAATRACAADTAAPPELVGVLALAVEGDVADQLGLTEGQRQKLLELIEARESEALELAIQLKNLPPAERAAKLIPFRQQSESRGLALLSKQQRARLQKVRVARWGLAGAVDAEVAEKLKLSPQQQSRVAELVREQSERLVRADEKTAQAVRAETDRKVSSVLDPEQRAALQTLADAAPSREEAKQEKNAEVKPQEAAQTTPPQEAAKTTSPQEMAKTPPLQDAAKTTPPQETAKTPPQDAAKAAAPQETAKTTPPQEAGKAAPSEAVAKTSPKEAPPAPGSPSAPATPGKVVAASDRLTPAKSSDKLKFNFRYQPWKDVLDWFAETADLSLVGENIPKGTCNYTDSREYTAAEAIDLLNSMLQTKGYTLVRKGRMLMVIYLEDGIPPTVVETVGVEELDKRGQFEILEVVFQLQNVSPEEADQEINKLKGPQGSVTVLPKSRQLRVIETGGRLRLIRQAIQAMENPQGAAARIRQIELKYADPQDALILLRQLLDIPADKNTSTDGSVHIVLDPIGGRLLVTGKPDAVARVEEVVKVVDVPDPANPTKTRLGDAPQLEVYAVTGADPNSVLQVLQTLLAGMPEVRLSVDPKTGNIIALGRRAAHATIKATLEQLQRDARRLEVFQLRSLDAQLAVAAITKLFAKEAGPGAPTVDGDPYLKRLLVRGSEAQIEQIRQALQQMGESGTSDRLNGSNLRVVPLTGAAARTALEGLEEVWATARPNNPIRRVTPSAGGISTRRPSAPPSPAPEYDPGGNPSAPPGIQREPLIDLLQRLQKGAESPPGAPAVQPDGNATPATPPSNTPPQQAPAAPVPPAKPESAVRPGNKSAAAPQEDLRSGPKFVFTTQLVASEAVSAPADSGKKTTGKENGGKENATVSGPADAAKKTAAPVPPPTVVQQPTAAPVEAAKPPVTTPPSKPSLGETPKPPAAAPSPKPSTAETPKPPAAATQAKPVPPKTADSGKEKPPIIVRPSPGGVIIASEDQDALDEFERLLTTMAGNFLSGKPELTVFYLKHAKASLVAETLDQILGGGTLGSSGSGGGSLIGDLAGAALGDVGGGLLGTLLGGSSSGGGTRASGTVQITADNRLNALIVHAKPADLDTIEQLLKILDERESPEEILASPKPQLIPVFNTQAEEIANVVRQVYQDRMAGQAGAGAGRPPTPQDFIMAMRNMRGGRGGSQRGAQEEPMKMSIGVDARTNSLVVVAPDVLLQEVKDLVHQLDEAAVDTAQTLQVVTLQRANSETIRQALSAMVGSSVQFGRSGTSSAPSSGSGQQPQFGFSRRGFGSPFGFGGIPGGGFPGSTGGTPSGFPGGGPSPFFNPFTGSPGGGSPFSGSRGMFGPSSMPGGGSFGSPSSSSRGDSGRRSSRSRGSSSRGSSRGR